MAITDYYTMTDSRILQELGKRLRALRLRKNVTLDYSGEIKTPPTERSPQGRTIGMSIEIVTTVEPIE